MVATLAVATLPVRHVVLDQQQQGKQGGSVKTELGAGKGQCLNLKEHALCCLLVSLHSCG